MLNVQADLRGRLALALAPVEVRVRVPEKRPSSLVTVRREGGYRENRLIDSPGVGIYCYAPTEAEACALADRVADAMQALGYADGYARVSMEAMRSDPDPDADDAPRWYLSYTIKTYEPNR